MNYYDILGVNNDATQQDIKKAYRFKVKQYHPDKNDAPTAQEHFIDIQTAYEVLIDENRREEYDLLNSDQQMELYDIVRHYFKTAAPSYVEIYDMLVKKYDIDKDNLKTDINSLNLKNIYHTFMSKLFENKFEDKSDIIPIYQTQETQCEKLEINETITTNLYERYQNKLKKVIIETKSGPMTFIIPCIEDKVVIENDLENDLEDDLNDDLEDDLNDGPKKNIGDITFNIVCEKDSNFVQVNGSNIFTNQAVSLSQYLYGGTVSFEYLDGQTFNFTYGSCVDQIPIFKVEAMGLPKLDDGISTGCSRGDLYIHLTVDGINSTDTNDQHKKYMEDIIKKLFPPL